MEKRQKIAEAFYNRAFVERDRGHHGRWLSKLKLAASYGYVFACYKLGQHYFDEKDYTQAITYFRQSIKDKDWIPIRKYLKLYVNETQSVEKIAKWWRYHSELRYHGAKCTIVAPYDTTIMFAYRSARDKGDVESMERLAEHFKSIGDTLKMKKWLNKAKLLK